MAPLSASELKDVLEWTIILARNAGKIMLEGSQAIQIAAASEDTGINEKKNSVDLVTEYDVKVEELVKKEIREKYPSFKLYVSILTLISMMFIWKLIVVNCMMGVPVGLIYSVGEETAAAGNRPPLTDEPTFCVDPIGMISPYLIHQSFEDFCVVYPRWNYELRARFPLCLHLSWSHRRETSRPRRHRELYPLIRCFHTSSSAKIPVPF